MKPETAKTILKPILEQIHDNKRDYLDDMDDKEFNDKQNTTYLIKQINAIRLYLKHKPLTLKKIRQDRQ